MNIFARATKQKLRFELPSKKKGLSVENLWELSLEDLDQIAVPIHSEIQKGSGFSLVGSKTNESRKLNLQMDILKAIVEQKQSDKSAAAQRAETKAYNETIDQIIADKQTEGLKNLSLDELQKLRTGTPVVETASKG